MTHHLIYQTTQPLETDSHFEDVKRELLICESLFTGELANGETKQRIIRYLKARLSTIPKTFNVEVECWPHILTLRVLYDFSNVTLTVKP